MNINNGITQRNNAPASPKAQIQSLIASKGMEAQFRAALPSVITPERFTRLVLTAISTTPKLASCSQQSFLGAIFQAAQLGLEPNTPTGQAYLIPYGQQCQFVLGYRGLIQLAYRSGDIRDVSAQVVYENDEFTYELGLEPKLVHKPKLGKRGAPIGVYATYHTKTGGYGMDVMSWDEVMDFAKKKSRAYSSGPWKTDPEEMAKKTIVKRLLKYAPISADFIRAAGADETVKDFDPTRQQASDLLDEMGTVTIATEASEPQDAQPEPPKPQEAPKAKGAAKAKAPAPDEPTVPFPAGEETPLIDQETGEVLHA